MMYSGDDYFSNMSSFGNYSDENLPEDSGTQLPAASTLSILVYALTFLLGVTGNGAVIWVTGFKMKRSVNTVWFLNLAVADLTYCLSLPFQMANIAMGKSSPRANVLCKLLPSAIILNMYASVFLLTMISIDRCLAVTRPVWSQTHRSLPWVRAACLAAWGLAFLMCLPTLLTRKMYFDPEFNLTSCTLNYTGTYFGDRTREVVEVTRALFAFIIPFLIMAFCYLLIGQKLQRGKFAKSSKTRKPVRLIAVVVAAFFLCWLPYNICGLAQAFSKHHVAWVWDNLSMGLVSLNSALNPILYVFAGRDFRQVFRRSLCTSLRLAFAEERTESIWRMRIKTSSSTDARFIIANYPTNRSFSRYPLSSMRRRVLNRSRNSSTGLSSYAILEGKERSPDPLVCILAGRDLRRVFRGFPATSLHQVFPEEGPELGNDAPDPSISSQTRR
ncbi:C3a anaphylatoxin chemotactic receptor-like [Hemitrygon akajei]|uniref:C3a anaphylatoxin chemotactic receptor-like n=1 Tax=Hemitrygon akajei TaxID=2704970 RepID=UPI003BF95DB6